jgi:hypothetical protein
MSEASTGRILTPAEQERIRLNAPRFKARVLAQLMGREVRTIQAWARRNGVEFMGGQVQGKHCKSETVAAVNRLIELAFRRAA